jgi:hypothetical protein
VVHHRLFLQLYLVRLILLFSIFISMSILEQGMYIITQVHSASEFYGYSQKRERELENLSKLFDEYYNNTANDSSLSVMFFVDGTPCVIQQGDKYHRVIIR